MLRDLPSFPRNPDIEVFMNNTPDTADEGPPAQEYTDPFDDVFGSAPSSPILRFDANPQIEAPQVSTAARPPTDPSDIPRLRSVHVTNGYREGIAASKEQHIQAGFDEGYSLGAEVALKAGWILGVLEGIFHSLPPSSSQSDVEGADGGGEGWQGRVEVKGLFVEAERELKVERLFGREFFGEDGVWTYEVPGQEDEGEVTFAKVAEAHPVISKWMGKVRELTSRVGLDFDGEKR